MLVSAACVATAVIALAQPARPAAVVSLQVLPDQRVTFRLRAPNAQEVTITGDFWLEQTRTAKLAKDDQGVWSITLGPFSPDIYGLNADRIAFYEKQYPGVLDNPANVKRVSVYIGDGVNAMTFAGSKYLAGDLKRRGYKTVYTMTNGIHGWPWFRRYFAEFAQMAIQ